jgi:hypothetical protein
LMARMRCSWPVVRFDMFIMGDGLMRREFGVNHEDGVKIQGWRTGKLRIPSGASCSKSKPGRARHCRPD